MWIFFFFFFFFGGGGGGPIKIEYFLVFNVGKSRVILSVFQQLQIFLGGMLKIPDIFGG